jgi:hypothetical protein
MVRLGPSGAMAQCEFDPAVGFQIGPLTGPQPAFSWTLCDPHFRDLRLQVRQLVHDDLAALALAMGRTLEGFVI